MKKNISEDNVKNKTINNQKILSRVVIVGTSHVSEESVKQVKDRIEHEDYNVVCIELDKQRLYALSNDVQETNLKSIGLIRQVGITGYLFALIASFAQKKIGKKLNTKPGSEMLIAAKCAAEKKIPIALIDQDVRITLKKLSKEMKFREKLRIIFDILKSLIGIKTALTDIDNSFDLKKTPTDEIVTRILKKTKHRYPGLFKVLVDDRNKIMSRKIMAILKKNTNWNVLVVVGAGHKEGMIESLEKISGEIYKEKDIVKKSKNKLEQNTKIIYSDIQEQVI